MGWLIALGILTALAVLPMGIDVQYDEDGFLVNLVVWKLKLLLYPKPKQEKKQELKKEAASAPVEEPLPQPPQPPKPAPEKKEKNGGSLLDFLPFVKLALDFLGDFRRKLRLDILNVKLTLAGGDPADLALNYGRTWAAIGNLQPQLERLFVIKKRDIQVQCDFTAPQTSILAHIRLTITLGRTLGLLAVYGVRALKEFLTFKNKRKGGKENEPEVT